MPGFDGGGNGEDEERLRDVARRYNKDFVALNGFRIPFELLKKVPVELMFRFNFVPLEETDDGKLAVAIADPSQLLMIDEIALLLKRSVVTKVSTLKQISDTLKRTEELQRRMYE